MPRLNDYIYQDICCIVGLDKAFINRSEGSNYCIINNNFFRLIANNINFVQ